MKLKKIASLALAGVMAVSMLAGCGNSNSDNSVVNPPVEDNTPATGYSSQLGEELVSKNNNTRKLSMSDSTALNSALQSALAYAADRDIAWRYDQNWNNLVSFVTPGTTTNATHLVADRLIDIVGGETTSNTSSANAIAQLNPRNNTADANEDMSVALLYVVDGGVDINAAIERIAEEINVSVARMVNSYNYATTSTETQEVTYQYTGSVSADTITVDADHGKSMTFIAVQINRTVV